MNIDIVHPAAEEYAKKYSSALDVLLQQNESTTAASHHHAGMHSGHVQGKFLEMISRMIKPLRILEIGTFTGFSALSLAKGLEESGMLHTIEIRPGDVLFAEEYFKQSGHPNKIIQHTGDAMEIIPTLTEAWDLVFIDADKVHYIDYYELTLPAVKPGGWILADNVLFHGQVLEDEVQGKNAKAIHRFNKHVAADSRVEQVILTVRDGLMLIRKL